MSLDGRVRQVLLQLRMLSEAPASKALDERLGIHQSKEVHGPQGEESLHDRYVRRLNGCRTDSDRLVVCVEAEMELAHHRKRQPAPDVSPAARKARILMASDDVPSIELAVREGVSTQYVDRVRRSVRAVG